MNSSAASPSAYIVSHLSRRPLLLAKRISSTKGRAVTSRQVTKRPRKQLCRSSADRASNAGVSSFQDPQAGQRSLAGDAGIEEQEQDAGPASASDPASPDSVEQFVQSPDPDIQAAFTVRGKLLTHVINLDLGDGKVLTVKALDEEWREQTREILADAFADKMGGFGGYRKYMANQIGSYLKQHMNMPPLAVVIVGILSEPIAAPPAEGGADDIASEEQPESAGRVGGPLMASENSMLEFHESKLSNQQQATVEAPQMRETLVGTLELSFNPSTRTPNMTLRAPQDCGFLVNMAVAQEQRRQGYGAMLLKTAESFAALANKEAIYLHVRFKDEPAYMLYQNNGYHVKKEDFWGVEVFGLERLRLMCKDIPPQP